MTDKRKYCQIISMNVDLTNQRHALSRTENLAAQNKGAYVCISNVHMCIEVMGCNDFQSIVNKADLVIPDGKPLSWAQKLLGHSEAEQVRGQDIMKRGGGKTKQVPIFIALDRIGVI
jgi:N-acetylglucosaminyldiphosphoundecaprenol N-acetyl-beta-D-mannosaminyltransferase